jgi:hypothetical protein
VICAVATHRNPAGTGALHPRLEEGRANPGAAGIPGPVRTALFDTGQASKDNLTTPCEAELYVAVIKEARQTGRPAGGTAPHTMNHSWQQVAARPATPEGKALYLRSA